MPFVRMPLGVHTPPMVTDVDEKWWLDWTGQPGEPGQLHVRALGPGILDEQAQRAEQAAQADLLPIRDSSLLPLRPYQRDAVESVQRSWHSGHRAPLVVIATGGGKTVIASALARAFKEARGARTLFLAHRKELLVQTQEKIRMAGGDLTTGLVQASRNEVGPHIDVTIASVQTLGGKDGRRLDQVLNAGRFDLLILDEAHHAVSPQWLRVIQSVRATNPDVRVMGMTATPGRSDGVALDLVFDTVCYERNSFDLIRDGYLVPPKGFRVNIDLDLDRVRTEGGDYSSSQLSKLMNQPRVHEAIVHSWMQFGHNRKTIVFAVDVEHAVTLASFFSDAGYSAEAVHGKTKGKERDAIYSRFSDGTTKLLVNCEVLTEGFDDPSIECVLFARPTQSQALYVQMMGRGLRPWPGKTECLVIDCVGNSEKHRPVQLASLAGFDPNLAVSDGAERRANGEQPEEDEEELPEVREARIRGEAFEISRRPSKTRYQWRETDIGWVLQIPRIGYYLCSWSDRARHKCVISFFDQRPKRRHLPAREVVRDPIDFELAYGMVEGEMDRFFNARRQRDLYSWRGDHAEFADDDDGAHLESLSFIDVTDGVEDDLEIEEAALLESASWRKLPMSKKQRTYLLNLGAKEATLPETMGEASDMILILQVERDRKMRVPATEKQLAFLRVNRIAVKESQHPLTKGEAARLIVDFRRRNG